MIKPKTGKCSISDETALRCNSNKLGHNKQFAWR